MIEKLSQWSEAAIYEARKNGQSVAEMLRDNKINEIIGVLNDMEKNQNSSSDFTAKLINGI